MIAVCLPKVFDTKEILGLFVFGAGMGFVIGGFDIFEGNVRVDFGGGKIGVTKQLLDGAEVCTVLEQMSGKGVADGVGRKALLDSDEPDIALQDEIKLLIVKGFTGAGDEELVHLIIRVEGWAHLEPS